MAAFKFPQILNSSSPYPSEDEQPDSAAVEKLLDFKTEDEAANNQQTKIALERLIRRWKVATYALTFMICFLLLLQFFLLRQQYEHPAQQPFSPAEAAIEYKEVVFHNNFHEDRTPYQGPPTDGVDKAWNDLYGNIGIVQIDESDALRLPNRTLNIPGDDDHYIIGIEVFHQLHCLNTVRKALYPERYREKEGLTGDALLEYQIHLEHCVDSIRQVIMCYSDVSTIPWIINPYHERPAPDAHTTHVCRDFEKLQDWARERAFTQEEYDSRLAAFPYPQGQEV